MKTTMQEIQKILINKIIKKENGRLNDLQEGFNNGLRFALEHIEDLLEKEKEQIIEAYWGGLNGKLNVYSESDKEFIYGKGAEIYYENLIKK